MHIFSPVKLAIFELDPFTSEATRHSLTGNKHSNRNLLKIIIVGDGLQVVSKLGASFWTGLIYEVIMLHIIHLKVKSCLCHITNYKKLLDITTIVILTSQ